MSHFRDTSRWGTPGGPQFPHRACLPLLCLLCQGRPRPCSSRASRACVLGCHALSQARHTCFFTVPCGIITSLDLAIHNCCIYRMRASGACRDFFSRRGERFQSIRPPSCPLAWHRAGPRAVNMRAVDAATFTNNVVIESMFLFSSHDLFRYYLYVLVLRTAFIVIP